MELRGSRVHLTPLSGAETELVLRWRREASVASQLFSERPPTREEHEQFLARLAATADRVEFAIMYGGAAVGTVGLSHIDRESAEYGILIGEGAARGKGIAREASELILEYAFGVLGLQRVFLNVFADNESAIALYRRLGFESDPSGETLKEKDGAVRRVLRMTIVPCGRAEVN